MFKNYEKLSEVLKIMAPGTPLREALDNVLNAKIGGLIVIGNSPQVMEVVEGGFDINCDFRPTAVYELAKMDGAIILSSDLAKILKANVHLVPQCTLPSQETGIRHRTAERVARQTGAIVIAISQRRNLITLFNSNLKYVLRDNAYILTKANQAIQTLEKYKHILVNTLDNLSLLEFEEQVTVADVAQVLMRVEMVMRMAREIEMYVVLLGSEGQLINMQLMELTSKFEEEGLLIIRDYYVAQGEKKVDDLAKIIRQLAIDEKLEALAISRVLGFGGTLSSLELPVTSRGYRILRKLPRLPFPIIDNLVQAFNNFPRIMKAGIEELDNVDGIGEVRAKAIRDGLQHFREQLLLDRRM